ncbi:MAG: hypothetical protein L3J67_08495 [Hyphomicrobiaceae bacterium]|nr:hypothetical protein [Hyphomicrobiaceae bacterium]
MLEQLIAKDGLQQLATATCDSSKEKQPDLCRKVAKVAVAKAPEYKTIKPALCPVDLAERLAILQIDGGHDRQRAAQIVAGELGFNNI